MYTTTCVSMGCLQKDNNCIVGLSYIALQKLKEQLNSTMSDVLYVAKASALMVTSLTWKGIC